MPSREHVNPRVLDRLLAWGSSVVDFADHHAVDGLFVAEGWGSASGEMSEQDLFLLALTVTFTFWVDDRSDRYLDRALPVLNWEALFHFAETGHPPPNGTTPEIDALDRLSTLLVGRARNPAEHALWRCAVARMLRAMHFEEQCARGLKSPCYAECVELGAYSTGVEMILTGAYLVHELNRPHRVADLWLPSMERYMCIYQRLLNDLHSAEKERKEGEIGQVSNALLLMEKVLPGPLARAFVTEQLESFLRLLDECFDRLGLQDPFVRLIGDMRRQVVRWYGNNPVRYET